VEWAFLAQAVIAMLMITAPPDPAKIVFFNSIVANREHRRVPAALRVAVTVFLILGGAAVIGRELLELIGINLGAFGAVGGLVVTGMGFEMLYNGGPSKAQGKDVEEEGPSDESGLFLPLSTPLLAGPGAITTAITLSAQSDELGTMLAAVIGAAAVGVVAFASFVWLGGALSKVKPKTLELLMRIGGMLLATIGVQMLLGGLRTFYGF
jgi:multiple antibiotic resistance protein